jgi:hypothetical protein
MSRAGFQLRLSRYGAGTIALILVLLALANLAQNMQKSPTEFQTSLDMSSHLTPRKDKLGDGCYHVFLDVGSNIGVHARFLMEPHLYPNSISATQHFDKEFGSDRDNRDFCVFAFEPNPMHRTRQLDLQAVYHAMGWRYFPIQAGVGDDSGNITFYHMHDESNKEWGFNAVHQRNGRGMQGDSEQVPIIRFATWMLDEIHERQLPSVLHGNYSTGPKVVMKLDVEGMEYVTLPDLMLSGCLCKVVDFVFGEFHTKQWYFFPLHHEKNGLFLKDGKEAATYAEGMLRQIGTSIHCKTRYNGTDDESYLKDGIPFPRPKVVGL